MSSTVIDMSSIKIDEDVKNHSITKMEDGWDLAIPDFTPRKSQREIMEWIDGLPNDIRYILCELPVGGGKSPIALALSSYIAKDFGSAFILTPQKTLQKQYEDAFDEHILSSVYGRSNYRCEMKNTTCDLGIDLKPYCDDCPADNARKLGISSPNMILNYSLALTYFRYLTEHIHPRQLMVFDECHTLESHLVEFSAIEITESRCRVYGVPYKRPKDISEALHWIEKIYIPVVKNKIEEYGVEIAKIDINKSSKLNKKQIQLLRNYKNVTEHHEKLKGLISISEDIIPKMYVLISDNTRFKFKELFGKNNFKNLVLPMADKFLFMSSTILDKEEFCTDLGIDPRKAAMISLDSEFNVENREVIYKPVTKMNYGWDKPDRSSDRNEMRAMVEVITGHHADQSGIIHTGNFRIAEWLENELDTTHEIITHGPQSDYTRDEAIDYYLENSEHKPLLLISPSITEGMDLKGDKGRFAIIVKIPYPHLGDAWIKRRMELSRDWYNRQTITGVIQGCGRVVRSVDDWGHVYILDESFTYLYNSTKHIIPQWWKDGLKVI